MGTTEVDAPNRAVAEPQLDDTNMAMVVRHFNLFQEDRTQEHITEAIRYLCQAISNEGTDSAQRSPRLGLLAVCYQQRYDLLDDKEDLDKCVQSSYDAIITLGEAPAADRACAFHNLRAALFRRHTEIGDLMQLTKAIGMMEQLQAEQQQLEPARQVNIPWILSILSDMYIKVYEHSHEGEYLDKAIQMGKLIFRLESGGPITILVKAIEAQGRNYLRRYMNKNLEKDLDAACHFFERTVFVLGETKSETKPRILAAQNLAMVLQKRYCLKRDLDDLRKAIKAICSGISVALAAGDEDGRELLILAGLRDVFKDWYEYTQTLPPPDNDLLKACTTMLPALVPDEVGEIDKADWIFTASTNFEGIYHSSGQSDDLEVAILLTYAAMAATDPNNAKFGKMETAWRARNREWSELTGKIPDHEVHIMCFPGGRTYLPPEIAELKLDLQYGTMYKVKKKE